MAYWILRANAPSVTIEKKRVVLKSRRRVSISAGDELVLLSSESVFVDKARVLEVKQSSARSLTPSEEGEEKRWWEIHIDEWKSLPHEVDLTDASTSLTFVRNWRRPKIHVRLAYRRLPVADLETIELGDLFVARDAYLTLLEALPPRLIQLFLAETPPASRTWGISDYADRTRSLIEFIEDRVISVGRVAIAAQERWDLLATRENSSGSPPLYVWDESEAGRPIEFTSQVEAFRTLISRNTEDERFTGSSQLAEIAELVASRHESETRFEFLFRNRVDE